jgi:hypothetical protein
MAERKSGLQVAQEALETAERVHEKSKARVEKLEADLQKAREKERLDGRKVRAARLVAVDEETDSIQAEPTEAAPPQAGDDELV